MERKIVKIKISNVDNLVENINAENNNITYIVEL